MSQFKWKDLIALNSKTTSYLSPLSCLTHIDVNAFFAQVEQIRCHYTAEDPIVCVQWSSIIAVSYAAREYGVSRMDSIHDAMKKCDKLVPIHTAVFRKGEDFWQYHDGCGPWVTEEDNKEKLNPENYKVSLDPYRRESRKILKIFHEWCDLVEKASVDEVFLDLGRKCFTMLMLDEEIKGFDSLRKQFVHGDYDIDDLLPPIPRDLDIQFEGYVYNPENRPLFEDWDDIIFCLNSMLTQRIRDAIQTELGYTTSCGISRTKSLCKLASNFRKPNIQTIIKNSCIEDFLDNENFEITSFWTLGGLKGQELLELLDLPKQGTIKYIREAWPLSPLELQGYMDEKLQSRDGSLEKNYTIDKSISAQTAEKVFHLVRGSYQSPVTPRSMIKSMMSNKNLRGNSCNSFHDCIAWLEVFSGELYGRIRELTQEYNKAFIPRTLSVGFRGNSQKGFQKHTKSSSLVVGGFTVHSKDLLQLGTKLIKELDLAYGKTGKMYPLTNLNMGLSNFEILDTGKSIVDMVGRQTRTIYKRETSDGPTLPEEENDKDIPPAFECQPCNLTFGNEQEFQEHRDYHFATRLSESLNGVSQESKNLSYGERKLLFSQRKRPGKSNSFQSKNNKKIKNTGKMDICKYFSK